MRSLLVVQSLVADAAHQYIIVKVAIFFILAEIPIHNGNTGTFMLNSLKEPEVHDDGEGKHVLHG